jgi:hypothetical protein
VSEINHVPNEIFNTQKIKDEGQTAGLGRHSVSLENIKHYQKPAKYLDTCGSICQRGMPAIQDHVSSSQVQRWVTIPHRISEF